MKNVPLALIYGFISLFTYMKTNYTEISINTLIIILAWIILLCSTFTMNWMDKTTEGYFTIVVLLFLAARLAKYNVPEISDEATWLAIGVGMGVVLNSFSKEHAATGLFLLSIFFLEILAMKIDTGVKSVDFDDILPNDFNALDGIQNTVNFMNFSIF